MIGSKSLLRHGNLWAYRISLPSAPTLQSGEQKPAGAGASDLCAKPGGPALPEGVAGAGGAIAETKPPGTCEVVCRGVCPTTSKGRSCLRRIGGVVCSTAKGAGTVNNRGKGEEVAVTASGGGACGEFCLNDFPDEMGLDFVTPRGCDDGRWFLTAGVVPCERKTSLKATSRGVRRSSASATCLAIPQATLTM